MSDHTPGPWTPRFRADTRISAAPGEQVLDSIYAPLPTHPDRVQAVVVAPSWTCRDGELWDAWLQCSPADARLVAAAPDLLEALDRLVGEVRACWGMSGVREVVGNTNYDVVEGLIDQSLDALERALGRRVHRYPAPKKEESDLDGCERRQHHKGRHADAVARFHQWPRLDVEHEPRSRARNPLRGRGYRGDRPMNLKTWCADRRDHWLAKAAEHRKAGMVRSAAAAGGRAEAFAAVAARLEDHDPQDTVDALASKEDR